MDGPRPARPEELGDLVDLVEHVFAESENRPRFLARMFPRFLSLENIDNLYLIRDNGRAASALGTDFQTFVTRGCRIPCAMIGAVCTHPDYRGRRYSGLLVDLAYRRARQQGAVLVWVSGRRSVYLQTGAEPVWSIHQARADRAQLATLSEARDLDLARTAAGDLPEIVALHDREPVRFDWTPEWLASVPPRLMEPDVGASYLIRRRGRTVAAACLRWSVIGGAAQPDRGIELIDWFGDRRAVVAALPRILADTAAGKISCRFVTWDADMMSALQAAAFTIAPITPCYWTMKCLDWPRLLECLAPHLRRCLGADADALRATPDGLGFRAGAAVYATADEQTALRILFSRPEDYAERWAAIPAPVRDLAARAFPLPLRHYGLNYI